MQKPLYTQLHPTFPADLPLEESYGTSLLPFQTLNLECHLPLLKAPARIDVQAVARLVATVNHFICLVQLHMMQHIM